MATFPRPPLNDVKQDDGVMHYVRGGDFAKSDIGGTSMSVPGSMKTGRMGIKHVEQPK